MFEDFPRIIAAVLLGTAALFIADKLIGRPPGGKRRSWASGVIGGAVALAVYFGIPAIWPPSKGNPPRDVSEQLVDPSGVDGEESGPVA